MTFSIVAADPAAGALGIAVQSKFLAVGALVPFAEAGVGAVATQAFVDVSIGPRALDLLRQGRPPGDCIEALLGEDELREQRQFGIVSADGGSASFTGSECFDHASSITGPRFAAQGNVLAGRPVVEGLVSGFLSRPGRPLSERLLHALELAQQAGGDRRGQQSAAILVVRPHGGYGGNHDKMLDLRVDDHPEPISELRRLHQLHTFYFQRADPATAVVIDDALQAELSGILDSRGLNSSPDFDRALLDYLGWENLEERWVGTGRIDPVVLEHLRRTVRDGA